MKKLIYICIIHTKKSERGHWTSCRKEKSTIQLIICKFTNNIASILKKWQNCEENQHFSFSDYDDLCIHEVFCDLFLQEINNLGNEVITDRGFPLFYVSFYWQKLLDDEEESDIMMSLPRRNSQELKNRWDQSKDDEEIIIYRIHGHLDPLQIKIVTYKFLIGFDAPR